MADCDCACPAAQPAAAAPPPARQYWLLLHLALSFFLVAHVRWSRVAIHSGPVPVAGDNNRQDTATVQTTTTVDESTEPAAEPSPTEPVEPPPPIVNPAAAKYLTMLKVGMPRAIVEHKMRMDGVSPSLLGAATQSQPSQVSHTSPRPPPIEIPPPPPAAAIEQRRYAAFQQMLKVGVPRHAVEHKLRLAGLDPAGLADDGSASPRSAASTAPSTPEAVRPKAVPTGSPALARATLRKMQANVRKKLHWTTTAVADAAPASQRRDSLWNRVHQRANSATAVPISQETVQWMDKLFVKAVGSAKKQKARRRRLQQLEALDPSPHEERAEDGDEDEDAADPAAAFLNRKQYVTLLERNKSQNIAIVLARVKRTHPQLALAISELDATVLPPTALQTLLDMWPDTTEQAALDSFTGDVSSLATAERFLLELQKVPRAQQKLRCLLFKVEFGGRADELRRSMELVVRGVAQVIASDAFGHVLEYVFHLGNLLNFGGKEYASTVKSISISSLAKLSLTKAYDGRSSFLQYVVQSIERDAPHLAHFGQEIDLIAKSSKVSVPNVLAELSALQGGVKLLEIEAKQTLPAKCKDERTRELFETSRRRLRHDAMALGQQVNSLRDAADDLERQRKRFLDFFEEQGSMPLDELLGFIASFVTEYAREREQMMRRTKALQRSKSHSVSSPRPPPLLTEMANRHSV